MTSVLRNKAIWFIAFNVFFVYTVYCGLTFLIPFLENIYLPPVVLVGAYGIINQYRLKMTGGPIGGMISDKTLRSPSKYLYHTFIIDTTAFVLLTALSHESTSVYLGTVCTLGFDAVVFIQQTVLFTPIGEAKIVENKTGAAMALGSSIGYTPTMFCFSLYGYILDLNPGTIGYKIVSGVMTCFAFCGTVVSVMLVKRTSQRKKRVLAAEA